jgi:IS5 family transposase
MYAISIKDINQLELLKTFMPFKDHLNNDNRWIVLADLIDWAGFERSYSQTFSHTGRPAIKARMLIGALILKHILCVSDEEITQQIAENPYLQYFIGMDDFRSRAPFHYSSLSNARKRLGEKEFDAFEQYLIESLIREKLIKPKGFHVDATVFESDITYPTDSGLLNKARGYCVDQIRTLSKITGRKIRTSCRKAQQEYRNFQKKKRKTKKEICRMNKSLLQYLRRNIRQLTEIIAEVELKGHYVSGQVLERLETIKEIYTQQKHMYDNRTHQVEGRIVSLSKPYVRPIVRGKTGKNVEFGLKGNLSYVDAYLFLDHYDYESFHEGTRLPESIEKFEARFNKHATWASGDQIYGTRENRRYLRDLKEEGIEIRTSMKPLGRPRKDGSPDNNKRWRRKKQRERNRIEGAFGVTKEHYLLKKVRARRPDTELSWIQMGLLSHNLVTAARRI